MQESPAKPCGRIVRAAVTYLALASTASLDPLAVGGIAFACLVVAELDVAWGLGATDPAAYLASRDPVSGTVYAIMLLVHASMPALIAHRQRARR